RCRRRRSLRCVELPLQELPDFSIEPRFVMPRVGVSDPQSIHCAKQVKMVKQQAKSQKEQAEAGAAASRRAGFLGCPRRLLFGVLPVAVLMTGCSSVNRNTGANTTDPLLGGVNLRPAVPATGPVPQGTPQTASPQAALPFPPADSGLSTAALAAGMSKPF